MRFKFFYVIFTLCVFCSVPTISSAGLVVDDVLREVYAAAEWSGGSYTSHELGFFDEEVHGNSKDEEGHIVSTAYARQYSTIILGSDSLTIEGEGCAWLLDVVGDARSLLKLYFTIDQDYSFSLSGNLKNNCFLELKDQNGKDVIYHFGNNDLDDTGVLPEGKYLFNLEAENLFGFNSFENISFTMEPVASVPIPSSFWLLLVCGIFLVCVRRQLAI